MPREVIVRRVRNIVLAVFTTAVVLRAVPVSADTQCNISHYGSGFVEVQANECDPFFDGDPCWDGGDALCTALCNALNVGYWGTAYTACVSDGGSPWVLQYVYCNCS